MATSDGNSALGALDVPLQLGMADMAGRKAAILACQQLLAERGFSPGAIDGVFGPGTQAAVIAFQRSEGLLADGVVGARTGAALLGSTAAPAALPSVIDKMSLMVVAQMFPHTAQGSIKRNLPFVLGALTAAGLVDRPMVLTALATIRAETEGFEPIPEGIWSGNTSPGGHPFDLYDNNKKLGNRGSPDGSSFCGRGFIQLTGRYNYTRYGPLLSPPQDLVNQPKLACDPAIAAQLLALFLKDQERPIKEALLARDFRAARKCVNGGSNGLDRFTDAYLIGERLTA